MHSRDIAEHIKMQKVRALELPLPILDSRSRNVDRVCPPEHDAEQHCMPAHALPRQVCRKTAHVLDQRFPHGKHQCRRDDNSNTYYKGLPTSIQQPALPDVRPGFESEADKILHLFTRTAPPSPIAIHLLAEDLRAPQSNFYLALCQPRGRKCIHRNRSTKSHF